MEALRRASVVIRNFEALAIGVLLCNSAQIGFASDAVRLYGTYSSLHYNVEGGDLLGLEVHIIPTRHGVKAIVQNSEGEPGDIEVVDLVQGPAGILSFDVPLVGQKAAKFQGKLSADGLRGKLTYPSGAADEVFLKRTTSYWERSTTP